MPSTFVFTVDKAYAPSFVLNCLTATVAAVVDSKLVKEHVAAGHAERRIQVRQ